MFLPSFQEKNRILVEGIKILIPVIFLLLFFRFERQFSFMQDDAYTAMRYARNFAEGRGLVFNPGEKVEGYTSFLWVVILSGAYKAGVDLEVFSQVSSILFGALVIILTALLIKKFLSLFYNKNRADEKKYLYEFLHILAYPLFCFNSAFLYWAASGMEEMFFLFLYITTLYLYLRKFYENRLGAGFVFISILTCLTRPEGILLISVPVIVKFIIVKRRSYISISVLAKELAVIFVVLSIFLVLRIFYYGYPLPNTFYAKSGFSIYHIKRGVEYLVFFLRTNLFYGLLLFFPLATAIIKKDKPLILIVLFSCLFCFAITIIGGDVLPLHRLFFPVIPLIYLSFIASLILWDNLKISAFCKALIMVFAVGMVCINNFLGEKSTAFEKREFELGLVAKMKIYAEWAKDISVEINRPVKAALSTIGAFSYFSGAEVIDLAGLTDEYTAHNPKETPGITDSLPVLWKERTYNAEYVLKCKPDLIIFPAGGKPSAFPECALFVNPEFERSYYMQLIYTQVFNEYLPVFTVRKEEDKENKNIVCDNSFVSNYINASNYFLKLTQTNNADLLLLVEEEVKKMITKCPDRKSEALSILGMAMFHIGNYNAAQKILDESVACDSLNSMSLLYLRNVAWIKKDSAKAITCIMKLKKISPDALPNIVY